MPSNYDDWRQTDLENSLKTPSKNQLTKVEIERYSRQLLVPELGILKQKKLLDSKVLVIGAGGLGSSVCLHLAGSGIGKIGIVDFDLVEASNLHRQIIHNNEMIGIPKALSAKLAINKLNPLIEAIHYVMKFDYENALQLIADYELLIDATDNQETKYLLNDVSFFMKKPLVSGSAIGLEGHLTVYNWKGERNSCYRCSYPKILSTAFSGNCSDIGVIGVLPGIIGSMQAMEVIKLLCEMESVLNEEQVVYDLLNVRLLKFKKIRKRTDCVLCGISPSICSLKDSKEFWKKSSFALNSSFLISKQERITTKDFDLIRKSSEKYLLLDVREQIQFQICSLENSLNIPLKEIEKKIDFIRKKSKGISVYVICRRGNDSQEATYYLKNAGILPVYHIEGGLTSWSLNIDNNFPLY